METSKPLRTITDADVEVESDDGRVMLSKSSDDSMGLMTGRHDSTRWGNKENIPTELYELLKNGARKEQLTR
jgi:hypothetical protein